MATSSSISARLNKYIDNAPLSYLTKGDTLLRPGQLVKYLYYVKTGHITQYDIAPNGNQIITNVFTSQSFLPLACIFSGSRHNSYYFEAADTTEVYQISLDMLDEIVANFPSLLIKQLAHDGLINERRMAHLMGGNAESRLLFELLNATEVLGEIVDSQAFIPLTVTDIAKRSGLSRETVSRTIGKLSGKLRIEVKPSQLIIHDFEALRNSLDGQL